jgi:hypothetical protein
MMNINMLRDVSQCVLKPPALSFMPKASTSLSVCWALCNAAPLPQVAKLYKQNAERMEKIWQEGKQLAASLDGAKVGPGLAAHTHQSLPLLSVIYLYEHFSQPLPLKARPLPPKTYVARPSEGGLQNR